MTATAMSLGHDVAEVVTLRFGTLAVPTDELLHFPAGLPGFETALDFVLLPVRPGLAWLQSAEIPALAFLLVEPVRVNPEAWADDSSAWAVVTFGRTPADATANLMAPIRIDASSRTAEQVIAASSGFTTAEPFDLARI
ncbi:MAG TPA: flagellar assembly protein FliW [Gemmatimonadales bacterium]|nr:flagellar assembly protein FliW [Gemmatimonadales bacterium]